MEIFIKRYLITLIFCMCFSLTLPFCQAFFTPQDDITALLISMIDREEKCIFGAVYMFTDKKIAQAIINAKNRGVEVILILDQISMTGCGKGKFLEEQGVFVIVHRTQSFNPYTMALMHHKFFVFGCNYHKKAWVWTGSWNCTLRATQHNDENVLLLDESAVVVQYLEYFYQLQQKLLGLGL